MDKLPSLDPALPAYVLQDHAREHIRSATCQCMERLENALRRGEDVPAVARMVWHCAVDLQETMLRFGWSLDNEPIVNALRVLADGARDCMD